MHFTYVERLKLATSFVIRWQNHLTYCVEGEKNMATTLSMQMHGCQKSTRFIIIIRGKIDTKEEKSIC